jgi:hypothetical protein
VATKKDLVEAYSFSRRRLVTAFLSGAPGGREVEPARPGRTVVGGLALAVLLIAGAAIASVLASRTPEDWNKVGFIVTRGDQPTTYVILKEQDPPQLIPIINTTSAQLIFGADVKATEVDQDTVDEQTPGLPIGILGAPPTLPKPDRFIQSGWTACTGDKVGVAVDVSSSTLVTRTTTRATVVQTEDGQPWLIATSSDREADDQRAYRYPISADEGDQFLVDSGLTQKAAAITVPVAWLALFPEGGEIGPAGFELPRFGKRAEGSEVPHAKVGDYVVLGDGRGAMIVDNGYQPLDPFALAMLQNMSGPTERDAPTPTSYLQSTYLGSHWPETSVSPLNSPPCAQLDVDTGRIPHVWLAGDAHGDAAAPQLGTDGSIPADERRVRLDRGHGAFVLDGTWDETEASSPIVIDPLGKAFQITDVPVTLANLGYDEDTAPVVPDEWVSLFDQGVALSTYAALCPPADQPGEQQPRDGCQEPPQ